MSRSLSRIFLLISKTLGVFERHLDARSSRRDSEVAVLHRLTSLCLLAAEMLAVVNMIQRRVDYLVLWGFSMILQITIMLLKRMRRSEHNDGALPETQARAKAAVPA